MCEDDMSEEEIFWNLPFQERPEFVLDGHPDLAPLLDLRLVPENYLSGLIQAGYIDKSDVKFPFDNE